MKLEPKAILFDMDGVLVDSLDSWWKSLDTAMKNFGREGVSRDEFIEKYWGRDLQYNLKVMGLSYEILNFCNRAYAKNVDSVRIYPDTIDTLRKLKGYPKAIITNTPRDCAIQIIKSLKLEEFFEHVVTSDEVSMGKPSPEIVYKSCLDLNVEPKDVVLVGDTASDIEAGKSAGCTVIGMRIKADYKINSLSDLVNLLVLK